MIFGKNRKIRKWKKQRYQRGFCDRDVYSIKDWFIKIIPEMLGELIKHNQGFPSSLEDEYYQEHQLDESKLSDEEKAKISNECFLKWQGILREMQQAFYDANEETSSFKNKYQKEYYKAFDEYYKKYGWDGEKLKNNPYVKHESDGSIFIDLQDNPYLMENLDQYKDIDKLYYDEEKKVEEFRDSAKKKALSMFMKYFDDLWW